MAAGAATFFVYMALERAAVGRPGAPADAHAVADHLPLGTSLLSSFRFPPAFWYITLLCVTFYSAVFPFQAYAPDILVQKFGYSVVKAGFVASLLILGTMICTPLFGWIIDHFGKRATFMILGAALLVPSYLLLAYTRLFPGIPIFAVGVAMSLVPAALWAAVPMMVPERRLGLAFGIVGWVQNVGLMACPWVAGRIADAHTTMSPAGAPVIDYTSTLLLFVALGVAGLVFSILLKWADARRREGPSIESVLLHGPAGAGLE
jgi:MFS family permease